MSDAKFLKVIWKRLLEIVAILMIGESVIALLRPARYARLWKFEPFEKVSEKFARNPFATRGIAALELGLGLWLALRQVRRS